MRRGKLPCLVGESMNGMELGNPENNPFKPINETVYTYLYQAIIGLEFKPGTLLVESKIAAELNVSRSPVKAALRRLELASLGGRDEALRLAVVVERYVFAEVLHEPTREIEAASAPGYLVQAKTVKGGFA